MPNITYSEHKAALRRAERAERQALLLAEGIEAIINANSTYHECPATVFEGCPFDKLEECAKCDGALYSTNCWLAWAGREGE